MHNVFQQPSAKNFLLPTGANCLIRVFPSKCIAISTATSHKRRSIHEDCNCNIFYFNIKQDKSVCTEYLGVVVLLRQRVRPRVQRVAKLI